MSLSRQLRGVVLSRKENQKPILVAVHPDPNNNNFWRCGGRVCEDTPCCHKRTTVWKVYPQCIPPKRCSYHTYVCSAPFWETLWLLTEEIGIYD